MSTYSRETVEWVDTIVNCKTPWHDIDEAVPEAQAVKEDDMMCYTTGWVIAENQHTLTIVHSYTADEVSAPITIPKCAVRKRTRLMEGTV